MSYTSPRAHTPWQPQSSTSTHLVQFLTLRPCCPGSQNLSIPTTQKIQFPHPINVLHTHPTPPSGLNPALLDPYLILINWQILVGGLQPKISQFLVVFLGKFGKIVCWPPWRGLFIGGSRGQDQFHVVFTPPANEVAGR